MTCLRRPLEAGLFALGPPGTFPTESGAWSCENVSGDLLATGVPSQHTQRGD
jgi:hypothetical protein